MQVSSRSLKAQALAAIRAAVQRNQGGAMPARPALDLIELALNGKQMGFEKVIAMIDELVANLKKEQVDDDSKKSYCENEFDKSDDKKKGLENSISDSEGAIENMQGNIATLKDEMAALEAGIKALDKSVAEATELRKTEHADHQTLMTDDTNAKEVLLWAKNRLNKFYSPKMYKSPPKRELSEAESITVSMGGTLAPTPAPGGYGGTGIGAAAVLAQASVAPPPPPETFGAYTKKGESGTGVIAMIDLLVADLDKEMQESEVMETDSQKEYEEMMSESAAKRAQDSKSLTDKTSAKAAEEEELQAETDTKAGTTKELAMTLQYIGELHGECDWLVKYSDVRKSARAGEVDALGKAIAVLNGADYSLLQLNTATCPSTSVQCGMQKDAAGDTVFVAHELPSPGTCVNVASQIPQDGKFKICGPGKFSLSRMSCDKHDYKAVTIEQANDQFTASDCKVYTVSDFYQVHGYIGSAKFECAATSR